MLTANPKVLDAMHFDAQLTKLHGTLKTGYKTPATSYAQLALHTSHSDSGCAYRLETPHDFNEHEGNEEHRTKATVAVQRSLPADNVLCPGSDNGLKACTNEDVFAIANAFSEIASDFERAVNFKMPK
ncbi:hypothetical protein HDU87_001715 [Geranomyces variabilis]|uniref:Uncharacterized protein n=1 Tax=Geranomyces variabilis TaxID=109894 RepID=A0AAD5TDD0_9FUNG|nr:hypothetical protein HDU87_001715 [Geranomyces variabilis]